MFWLIAQYRVVKLETKFLVPALPFGSKLGWPWKELLWDLEGKSEAEELHLEGHGS